jgi:excisionase family DNA binding protein
MNLIFQLQESLMPGNSSKRFDQKTYDRDSRHLKRSPTINSRQQPGVLTLNHHQMNTTKPQVAIIDNHLIETLIAKIERIDTYIHELKADVDTKSKPYLSTQDLMELTGFSSKWVIDNKGKIGFTEIGNQLRFKRKDVEQFMEQNYIKPKKQ